MIDLVMVVDARHRCEMARKAAAEGSPALARQFYMQAADRYRAGGMTLLARKVGKMADEGR